jgi:hypothetical protein
MLVATTENRGGMTPYSSLRIIQPIRFLLMVETDKAVKKPQRLCNFAHLVAEPLVLLEL